MKKGDIVVLHRLLGGGYVADVFESLDGAHEYMRSQDSKEMYLVEVLGVFERRERLVEKT